MNSLPYCNSSPSDKQWNSPLRKQDVGCGWNKPAPPGLPQQSSRPAANRDSAAGNQSAGTIGGISRARGITLIEVVAAMLLTATLLSATLVSYGRTVRQQKVIRERSQALVMAEELLAGWTASGSLGDRIPEPLRFLSEEIEAAPGWSWKLSRQDPVPLARHPEGRFELQTIRLEIQKTPATIDADPETLLSLDLPARISAIPAPLQELD